MLLQLNLDKVHRPTRVADTCLFTIHVELVAQKCLLKTVSWEKKSQSRRPFSSTTGKDNNLKEKRDILRHALHHLLDQSSSAPTKYASLLQQCADAEALAEGKQLHRHILQHEHGCNRFLCNLLINMYGKCGSPSDARKVFDSMLRRDLISWNAMISAYTRNGYGKQALKLFQLMNAEAVKPNRVTFICILSACASVAELEQGQIIHASILKAGLETDLVVGCALVNMYGKCGCIDHAREVFEKMPQRNVVCWNSMIAAYAQNGYEIEALSLLHRMGQEGIKPNNVTFICVLDANASPGALAQGRKLHACITNLGFDTDLAVSNALINMYGKCGSPMDALRIFKSMRVRNVISWNSMIAAYAQNGCCEEALELFQQMDLKQVKPTMITFLCVSDACASPAALAHVQKIHASIINAGFESEIVLQTALITMYGKCGSLENVRSLFDKMHQKDLVSWNAIISAYSNNGYQKQALELFDQIFIKGIKPDRITFISALDACASIAALKKGQDIHSKIVASGLETDLFVSNSLIHMYGQCGCLADARNVFNRLSHRDVVSWNTILAIYAQNGLRYKALELFQQMESECVHPNKVTFIGILSACSHAGLLDCGIQYLVSMSRDHGINPTKDHYACLLDLIGRAGQLDEAEDLINNMPFQPDAFVWRVLLGACRVHGEVQRAASAAKQILKSDTQDATPYVLLSNVYFASTTE